jgi:hypothetical protein
MGKRAAIGALASFAAIAAILWIPWATKDRVVIGSTPVPPALFSITPVPVKPGSTACLTDVTFSPATQIGEIGLTTGGKPGPPLDITATAPGYVAAARIPGGYPDDPSSRFNLQAPPGPVIGTLCIRNSGTTTVKLNGTNEARTMGRPGLAVDGVQQPVDAKLIFYQRVRSSYLSRAGTILGHAAVFTPAFFSKGVLIALALLGLIGIPVAITYALVAAVREDERAAD